MKLQLSTFSIRSLRSTDATSMARHLNNPNVSRYMSGVPEPYALSDAEEWLTKVMTHDPETHFAITIDDELVGGIGLKPDPSGLDVLRHSAEIGYWLSEPFWNRGILSEAVVALTDWAFTERHLVRLHAFVYAPNLASARVLEKARYEFEGRSRAHYCRNGQFIDALRYGKVRLPE
jgi:RimJ/RimL family protein N-acetyltransferase